MQDYNPPQEPLNILHEDDYILVLSKPSGLLSVPGRDEHLKDSLQTRVLEKYPQALLVHRLDMETSGIFIMAMNKEVQRNLGLQFERRKTQKSYIAWVWGKPEEDEGIVDSPLRCDWERRPIQMVCYEYGKPAQTKWRLIESQNNNSGDLISCLELMPVTGRSHQLRVHCAEIGHPILGDPFYANERAYNAAERLQLHAQSLKIHHPKNGELVTFHDQVQAQINFMTSGLDGK